MIFRSLPEFEKERKRYVKKFPSLEADLGNFKKFIPYVDFEKNSRYVVLKRKGTMRIMKTRLLVRSLHGAGMTRLVFSFCVSGSEITFIELFLKSEKEREDGVRIEEFLRGVGE